MMEELLATPIAIPGKVHPIVGWCHLGLMDSVEQSPKSAQPRRVSQRAKLSRDQRIAIGEAVISIVRGP